ncbi:MAG: TVP38/TMEM64 family protein [Dehalococcoidia bacterium]
MLSRRARAWTRVAVLGVIALSGVIYTLRVGLPSVDEMQASITGAGAPGLVAFVLAYVVCSLVLLPKGLLSIVAGTVWGLGIGVAVVMTGAILGAIAAFAVGRRLGRTAVEELAGRHLDSLDGVVERHGRLAIVVARLVPLIPFTVINYAAGVTTIRFADYVVGTAVGIVPGTVAYVALGAYGTDPGSWEFGAAVGAFGLLTIVGVLAVRRHRVAASHTQEG